MKVTVKVPNGLRSASNAAVKRALTALASMARDRITTLAQEKLHTSAATYVKGISSPIVTDKSATLVLAGKLANMMENGTSAFDLKKMLRGRKYVDVPFRNGTPKAGGTALKPMPQADFNAMQSAVRSAKGAMRGPRVMPTGPMTKNVDGGKYTHKESKYGSMMRISHSYQGSSQTQYLTIRRMSQKSDPKSWIHPGFKPLSIFPLVAKEVRKLAPKVIADYIREGLR